MTTVVLRKALDHFASLLTRHLAVAADSAVLDHHFCVRILEQAAHHCKALLKLLDQVDNAETLQLDDGPDGPVDMG